MNLLFAKLTYGPPPDPIFERSHRTAIMFAANHGVSWVGDISQDRVPWAAARNQVVNEAIDAAKSDHVDGLIWVDADVKVPIEGFHAIANSGEDIVSGLYFQRKLPYLPLFSMLNKDMDFAFVCEYPDNTLLPCDGIGFGCLYTSMRVLRESLKLLQKGEDGLFGNDFGNKTYGEDYTFCLRARRAGFRPHVNTAVKCDHCIGPDLSNEELFKTFSEAKRRFDGDKVRNPGKANGSGLSQSGDQP